MSKTSGIIVQLINWLIIITFAVLPLFFLPFTQNFYDTNKWMLLVCTASCILFLWGLRAAVTQVISIRINSICLSLMALTIASGLSLFLTSTNKIEALVNPIGITTFGALMLMIFFSGEKLNDHGITILRWALYISSALLGLIAIYMYFGIGKLMFPQASYLADPLWTPTGSTLVTISIFAIMLPLIIDDIIHLHKNPNSETVVAASAVIATLNVVGLALTIFQSTKLWGNFMTPILTGWPILLETYKSPIHALFGIGGENFITAFTLGKPLSYNTTSLWNTRFTNGASMMFHISTVFGLVGLGALLLYLKNIISNWPTNEHTAIRISFIIAVVLFFITPPNIVVVTLVTVILLIQTRTMDKIYSWQIPSHIKWLGFGIVSVITVLFGVISYNVFRYYAGEVLFQNSINTAKANDGTNTYKLQIQAMGYSPNIANYRIYYSQTNLAIANSIATNATKANQKDSTAKISDADRNTISQLVQQAIREAKNATTFDPNNVYTWENLARIYQNINGIVDGADTWAIAAYQQAIILDPTNPVLRMNLASVYIDQKNYDAALQQLNIALNLKPDITAVYYNIAYIYGQQGKTLNQALALKQTIALLPVGSDDAKKVTKELEDARGKLTAEEIKTLDQQSSNGTTDQTQLQPATTDVNPQITPKIQLPADASPSSLKPTPTIAPTNSPTPTQKPVVSPSASPTMPLQQ
jgi:Tfp pilus assembly protein PilF